MRLAHFQQNVITSGILLQPNKSLQQQHVNYQFSTQQAVKCAGQFYQIEKVSF